MRTTIDLAEDVAAAVRQLRRKRSLGLSEAVNELVRVGLARGGEVEARFEQRTHNLGAGIDVSNVGDALETLDRAS